MPLIMSPPLVSIKFPLEWGIPLSPPGEKLPPSLIGDVGLSNPSSSLLPLFERFLVFLILACKRKCYIRHGGLSNKFWYFLTLMCCLVVNEWLWNFMVRQNKFNRHQYPNEYPQTIFWYHVIWFEWETSKIWHLGFGVNFWGLIILKNNIVSFFYNICKKHFQFHL